MIGGTWCVYSEEKGVRRAIETGSVGCRVAVGGLTGYEWSLEVVTYSWSV